MQRQEGLQKGSDANIKGFEKVMTAFLSRVKTEDDASQIYDTRRIGTVLRCGLHKHPSHKPTKTRHAGAQA